MIQIHKSITLTPFHPTNGGMNAYKNFPSGRRVILSNDNRFTPIVTKKDGEDWEPMYGISSDCSVDAFNGVPGVFGESFNVDQIPHQIITNGVVDMPTDKYLAVPSGATVWKPGEILVLIPKSTSGWQLGIINPVYATDEAAVTKYSNVQVGVLLEPINWVASGTTFKPEKPTVSVLVGYSKIPKKLITAQAVKAAPLATPKVVTK